MSASEITVVNRQRSRKVATAPLRRFLGRIREAVPTRGAGVAVALVSDGAMRGMNRAFRGQDRTTDVLSFPSDGPDHLGDIAISVPRAAAQAREAGHPLSRELRVLLLHGYLHLAGYDHETDGGTMMRLQRRLETRLLGRGGAS